MSKFGRTPDARLGRSIWLAKVSVCLALTVAFATAVRHRQPVIVFVATVADSLTGSPLSGAEISMPSLNRSATTDRLGEARITGIPAGSHTVSVKRVGYVPAIVSIAFADDTIRHSFLLSRAPQGLDTVTTKAALKVPDYLHDFDVRLHMGIGRFLTDSILEKEGRTPIAQVMARRFPGFYVTGHDNGVGKTNCGTPTLYLDGTKSVAGLSVITAEDVAGVEFYTIASAPVQYRQSSTRLSPNNCGVLLIWLKR